MKLRKTVEEVDKKYHNRKVIAVDENDKELGIVELVEAHRNLGIKHRAFSLQLYRKRRGKVELLLQQRAGSKPVFPHYWANTCCYNMAPGEEYILSAVSRVREELGVEVDGDKLKILYAFSYYAPDIEGWCENEMDTVMVGEWDGEVTPNPEEAMDYKWIEWEELNLDVKNRSDLYAPWFKIILVDKRFRQVFE